ncbi:MAG: helix-turn-helix domain-containing protein [Rhodospirillales bacterium]|nr:helix-turn-helix domain-containing protein [Alphaproteobacteria bacterium]MCB9987523.1 helix-turn-helix domain-containing protein [Rhodospirillales bacterium]USO07503.1 MAG: helix-turn-helix domain-containing protein [Rhodospirillales bacterium]
MLKLRMADQNILDHYTDLPVGEVLRRARVQFGLELPYVGAQLNIRPEHLAAIEAGDISRLPGRVYAIGFVRTYADYLRLDSDKLVYLFKSQVIGHTASRDLNFPIPVTESRSPAWWMVGASLGTLAIIGLLFWILGGGGEPEPQMPAAVAKTENTPASTTPAAPATPVTEGASAPDQTSAQPAVPAGKLKITAADASWVEIRDADKPDAILFSRVLKKGESTSIPLTGNLTLSTGNAGAVSFDWNGKPVDVLEGRRGVVRNLPISALVANKAAPATKGKGQ